MESIHIRLEHNEALYGKRELLSSEANILKILNALKCYKSLRRKELILKNKLKREINATAKEIMKIEESFPQEAEDFHMKRKHPKKKKTAKRSSSIEKQLKEIQEKLSRLQ